MNYETMADDCLRRLQKDAIRELWTPQRLELMTLRVELSFWSGRLELLDEELSLYNLLFIKDGQEWRVDGYPHWASSRVHRVRNRKSGPVKEASAWEAGASTMRQIVKLIRDAFRERLAYEEHPDMYEDLLDSLGRHGLPVLRELPRKIKKLWKDRDRDADPPSRSAALLPPGWERQGVRY